MNLGFVSLITDDYESKTIFENGAIPYKNNRNHLIFGDFLENNEGFIGFIYQVSGYSFLITNQPHLELPDCNKNG